MSLLKNTVWQVSLDQSPQRAPGRSCQGSRRRRPPPGCASSTARCASPTVQVEDLVRVAGVARVLVDVAALRVLRPLHQALREGARPGGVIVPHRVNLPVDAVVADRPEQGVAYVVGRVRLAAVDHPPLAAVLVVEDRGIGIAQVVRVRPRALWHRLRLAQPPHHVVRRLQAPVVKKQDLLHGCRSFWHVVG